MLQTVLAGVLDKSIEPYYSVPFVGRRKELEEIQTFCRDVVNGEELGICWIQGEAGIGKSGLSREVEKHLKASNHILLSLCIYPDSVDSIISLMADAINASDVTSHLLADPVAYTLPSLLSALRRLTRLRPLVLIIEDLHLLDDAPGNELLSLVHGLRNESVSILCLSRLTGGDVYSRLLPYIRRSMEIPPLTLQEIEGLTIVPSLRNFNINPLLLLEASRGYPLLLHGLILELQNLRKLEGTNPSEFSERQRLLLNNKANISIEGLATTFLSGLTEGEQKATERLAVLGERFSPNVAQALLSDNAELLEQLLQHGVIVRSTNFSLPLYGAYDSAIPLRFNHTLVFEYLLQRGTVGENEIVDIIAQNLPLYSLTLFRQLERIEASETIPEKIAQAIQAMTDAARSHDVRHVFSQKMVRLLHHYAEKLFHRYEASFSSEQRRLLDLRIRSISVISLRHQVPTEDQVNYLNEFGRLTESPKCEQTALYRCIYLTDHLHHNLCTDLHSATEEAEYLFHTFPTLRTTPTFIQLLTELGAETRHDSSTITLQRTEALYRQTLASVDVPPLAAPLGSAGVNILYSMAIVLNTPSGVQQTISLANVLDTQVFPHCDWKFGLHMYGVLAEVYILLHSLPQAVEILHRHREAVRRRHDIDSLHLRHCLLKVQSAIGLPTDQLEQRFIELKTDIVEIFGIPEESPSRLQLQIGITALVEGYIRGDVPWGERLAKQICNGKFEPLEQTILLGRSVATGNEAAMRSLLDDPVFGPLLRAAFGLLEGDEMIEGAKTIARERIANPVVSVPALSELPMIIRVILRAQDQYPDGKVFPDLSEEIVTAIRTAINRCLEKQMPGYAIPFLQLGESLLPKKEHAKLKGKVEQMIEQMPETILLHQLIEKNEPKDRAYLSLIGAIAARPTKSDKEALPARFQGGRVRRMVALIAVNQVMEYPLSLKEFRYVATGADPDLESTTNYTRTLLWRIRSILGPDSIITDGNSPPRFNTQRICVDLLEAIESLEQCTQAVRKGHPRQAREALLRGLSIIGDGPLYPTLYDEFFEAARLDFEVRLQNGIRATVALLRREGDIEEAERLLRTAQRAMPGDEEMIEELIDVLQLLERNAEAVALRQKLKQEIGVGR